MTPRPLPVTAAAAAALLTFTGCATAEQGAEDVGIRVVASTNVYGDIVTAIAGDRVEVEALIESGAQDPHAYEASAQDQLAVSRADLIIENGGGYDAFVDTLIDASDTDATVLTAVDFSPESEGDLLHDDEHDDDEHDEHEHDDHGHIAGFNEHVWYDPAAMRALAEGVAAELTEIDPGGAELYAEGLDAFIAGLDGIDRAVADIAAEYADAGIFATEPVPGHLVAAAELDDLTPSAFSEAVEEGQDVPPATLLEATGILASGEVRVVIVNGQTGGAETDAVIDAAGADGIPVVEFSELVPEGETYLTWMRQNVAALADALAQ